jgi:enoyl-CoA hydratase
MRSDRRSVYEQFDHDLEGALTNEFRLGRDALEKEAVAGAMRFAEGAGRHGSFEDE